MGSAAIGAFELPPGTKIGGYVIEETIGRGGMGVVYGATQERLGRRVALKVIVPEFSQDVAFRHRFEQEARLAASIEHPAAVTVYEAGETPDGTLFMAMRYVDGTDLATVLRESGPLAPERAAYVISEVAGALDEAHALGLVHRDIKPHNILIGHSRGAERVYLTDFGLAKQTNASAGLTRSGQWVGTVDYVAPEQVQGERLDARVDVYALGCVLFQALTGRVPFEQDTDVARLFAHINNPPPSACALASGLPPEIDAVITRALAKVPHDRYPSAGDLARASTAALEGTPAVLPERSVATGAAAPISDPASAARPEPATEPAAATEPAIATEPRQPVTATGETAALPPERKPRTRRGLLPFVGLLALVAAAVVAVLVLGDGGGEEESGAGEGEDPSAPIAEQPADGADPAADQANRVFQNLAFSVEVPTDWTDEASEEQIENESENAPGPFQLLTSFASPDGDATLEIFRIPNVASSVDPLALANQAESNAEGDEGYESVEAPTEIGLGEGRDGVIRRFSAPGADGERGHFTVVSFLLDDDLFRVRGTSSFESEGRSEAAIRAARTLELN